jgi:hypothetical protein
MPGDIALPEIDGEQLSVEITDVENDSTYLGEEGELRGAANLLRHHRTARQIWRARVTVNLALTEMANDVGPFASCLRCSRTIDQCSERVTVSRPAARLVVSWRQSRRDTW